jgi:hypothetical protein
MRKAMTKTHPGHWLSVADWTLVGVSAVVILGALSALG